jgi:transcription factor E2F4/5
MDIDRDFINDFITQDGFAPLLRLSPPPAEQDYFFNLEDTEGVCDLFDVPSTGTTIPFGQTA